jgi:hypothetical protein
MGDVPFSQVGPIEKCAQSWTKRLSDFSELVFNFRWNLRMDGALHDAITLKASQLLNQHLL